MTKEELKEFKNLIGKIFEKLHSMDKTLVIQEEHLKIHIYRTELSEARLEKIEDSLVPIKQHVNKLEGALKLIGIIAVLTSIIVGAVKVITSF